MRDLQSVAGSNQVELAWRAPSNARSGTEPSATADEVEVIAYYALVERLDGTPEDTRIVRVDGTTRSAVISGLRNGVGYEFTVYAATVDGVGTAAAVQDRPTTGVDGAVAGLIVEFTPETAITEGQQRVPGEDAIDEVDLTVTGEIADGMHLVELSEAVSLDEAEVIAAEMQADPRVTWAEPDQFVFTAAVGSEDATPGEDVAPGVAAATGPVVPVPDDPLYSPDQWNLWGDYGIGIGDGPDEMTDALAQGRGSGTVVAVIDTGITAHPDLDAQLVTGYDFVSDQAALAAPRTPGGPDEPFDTDGQPGWDADPTDPGDWRDVAPIRESTWHGTHVAGLVAAEANNAIGIVGVAPGSKVQPIRALGWRGGLMSDIAASIAWASGGSVDGVPANPSPATVINMSFAMAAGCSTALQTAIDAAYARGAVLIAAAGNANDEARLYAPANCANVITVAATNRDGKRAPYSNYGEVIDIAAPGGDLNLDGGVLSTSNTGTRGAEAAGYARKEGTSVAAAHVAAAVARQIAMGSSPIDVRARLSTAEAVRPFADGECDPDPLKGCGPGILSLGGNELAQVQAACVPTITQDGTYAVATFSTVGTCEWTPPYAGLAVQYVVVGGGGGGGGDNGGGAGAGGFLTGSYTTVDSIPKSIVVGAGGASGAVNAKGGNGGNSSALGVTAAGGGGGGGGNGGGVQNGSAGGSGGGGGGEWTGGTGGAGTAGQGNAGANATTFMGGGSGGGGATAAGQMKPATNATWGEGGDGGAGQASSITGASVTYAGGGGGGSTDNTFIAGVGGAGGGGAGGSGRSGTPVNGTAGTANTGGGGGGGGQAGVGGAGGSGVVILRYYSLPSCTPTITYDGGYTVARISKVGSCAWSPPKLGLAVEYLVVGGGGGGGGDNAGGGGAGGLRTGTYTTTSLNYQQIDVGRGGSGGAVNARGSSGTASAAFGFSAAGGGGGGAGLVGAFDGFAGGSGGGAGAEWATGTPGAGNTPATTPSQGNAGGVGNAAGAHGGGGGGATAVGDVGASDRGGAGGAGTASSITGRSATYAGGGGGGGQGAYGSNGGAGGGGIGGASGYPGGAGSTNTGGGGGGGGNAGIGGNGGSGVVLLRYETVGTASEVDSYMSFPGGDVRASAPDGATFDQTAALTLSAWIYPTSSADSCPVMKEAAYGICIRSGRWTAVGINGATTKTAQSIDVALNQWTYVSTSLSSGTLTIRVNSTAAATAASTTIANSTGAFLVGGSTATADDFAGRVDEVRLWSMARTDAELRTDMQTYGTASATYSAAVLANLKAYFDFNDGSGSTVLNRSPSAGATTHLTAQAGTSWADVKTVSSRSSDDATVVTFPRTYLTAVGGWTAPTAVSAEVLVVAGGGPGAYYTGGGGGGGGVRTTLGRPTLTSAGVYPIVVGAGGVPSLDCCNGNGPNGFNSSALGVESAGGGSGGYYFNAGSAGGSGGGGARGSAGGAGNPAYVNPPEGRNGGGSTPNVSGGGGGGAGGAGQAGTASKAGDGGIGLSNAITGTAVLYSGGGGGTAYVRSTSVGLGAGGSGGGGAAGRAAGGQDGTAGLGGGGGATTDTPVGAFPGQGGSGVVVIAFTSVPDCQPSSRIAGSYQVVTFTNTSACNWSIPDGVSSIEYLLVGGGGGGGGRDTAGGGGGGGVMSNLGSPLSVSAGTTYSIAVGAGGQGGVDTDSLSTTGANGSNGNGTSAFDITASGGGGGGLYVSSGRAGASGGGGGQQGSGGAGNTPARTPSQGNGGGNGVSGVAGGGGGGGGATGGSATSTNGGNGGSGRTNAITTRTTSYGGGGGGSVHRAAASSNNGAGGWGGGGDAGVLESGVRQGGDGADGFGGGGGASQALNGVGGDGGDGVIIVRYAASQSCASSTVDQGRYTVVTFTNQGSCTWAAPTGVTKVDSLVVGGGGGGGGYISGGGGGGGGVRTNVGGTLTTVVPGTSYPVVVGAGGLGGTVETNGLSGSASSVFGITASGGGGGGSYLTAGSAGASGGGGARNTAGGAGNTPSTTPVQGYAGGTANSTGLNGGGGGGGGGAGVAATSTVAGNGGIGLLSSITGTATRYAGGGGGGIYVNSTSTLGTGGAGGGGSSAPMVGINGTDGLGGGGGASSAQGKQGGTLGGEGGSGVVIIRYGTVQSLRVATAPVGGQAGGALATQPVIELLDADGNIAANDSTTTVTITGSTGATLGCVGGGSACLTATASEGIVTFANVTLGNLINTAYTLTFTSNSSGASDPAAARTVTSTTTVTHAAASKLIVDAQPSSSTVAGVAFGQQPVVQVQDQYGNLVSTGSDATRAVSMALTTGIGTLSDGTNNGPITVTAVGGVATYTGLRIDKTGSNKVLTASATITAGAVSVATSPAFTITPGTASTTTSTITASPTTLIANGTSTSTVTIQLKDAYQNNLTSGGAAVTMSTSSGSMGGVIDNGNGSYTSTFTSPTTVGTATISGTIGGSTMTATATVTLTAGPAASIVTVAGGGQTATAGSAVNPGSDAAKAITVKVMDASGNVRANDSVTFAVTVGSGSLVSTTATTNASGIATVPEWTLGQTAGGNQIRATVTGSSPAVSTLIAAIGVAGPVTGFAVTVSGGTTALSSQKLVAGAATNVRVSAIDQYRNVNTAWTGSVALTSTSFSGSASATITAAGLVDAVSITPTIAGASQTITAVGTGSGGSASIASGTAASGFTVLPGPLAGFSVTQSGGTSALPSSVNASIPFDVRVRALDANGNVVTAWTGPVALSSTAFPGSVTATISSNGYVDSVSVNPTIAGASRVISATGGGVSTAAASSAFTVVPGAPASLRVTTQPIAARSGQPLATQPVVTLLDGAGNIVTTNSTTVVTVTAPAGTLGGTTSATAASGIATFTDLTFAGLVGTPYALTFAVASPSLSVTSNQVQVSGHGVATQLSVATPASSPSASGAVFTTVPRVRVLDSAGNVVTSTGTIDGLAFGPYDIRGSITSGSGGSVVGADDPIGTPTGMKITTVGGVATFAGMGLNGVNGTTYTVTFSNGGALTTASMNVAVTTGAATALSLASPGVQPAGAVYGTALTTQPKVQLLDSGGNAVSGAGVVISATVASGTGSLANDTATTDAAGLATFSGLALYGDAGSYQLVFGSPALTSVTADSFALAKAAQAIAFTPITSLAFGSPKEQLSATATSGLDVTFVNNYVTTTNSACSVSSTGLVTVLAVGTCGVTAIQSGDSRYAAATQVSKIISITAVAPGIPVITSVAAGNTSATVGFTGPSFTGGAAISAYEIVATPSTGTTVTKSDCSASASPLACTITGLVNGKDYTLTVAATNSAGTGTASSASTPVTPVTNPNAVTNLTAGPGVAAVTLNWLPSTNLGGGVFAQYQVSYRTNGASSWTECTNSSCPGYPISNPATTGTTVIGLANGVAHDFQVIVITTTNSGNLSSYTAEVSESPYTVPSAPLSPSVARGSSATSAVFSWAAPASDGGPGLSATPYVVTVTSATSGATTPVPCVFASAADPFCTASGLTNGATYAFTVKAQNSVGLSPAASTTPTYVVPSAVTALSNLVVDAGGTALTLTPSFASGTFAYAASVPYLTTEATITPTVSGSGATITVDGIAVTSGSASGAIALSVGANTVDVVVTAPDEETTRTTTVSITRASAPTKLAVGTAPVAGDSEAVLATQPVVRVQTASSALSTDSTAVVTVTASGGTLGCSAGGTSCLSKAAVNGVATFANLTFAGVVGTTYTLTFTSPGLASTSATISLTGAGAAAALAFTTQPSASSAAGSAFARQPVVTISDAMGNTVTTGADATASIALTLSGGTGALTGTKTINAASGVASFGTGSDTPLSINKTGTNKTLTATATLNGNVRTATTSPQFAVTPGAVNSIALAQSASGALASAADRTITATLLDAFDNTVTDATGDIAFSQVSGAGTLVGLPATVASADGVATVVVSGAQAGVVDVQASYTPGGGSAKTDTASITVVTGPVAQVVLVPAATGNLESGAARVFTATLKDALGNTVTGSSESVTFAKVGSSGSGTVTGLSSVNASSGVAAVTLTGATPGALQVQASVSSGSIASIPVAFNVVPGSVASITLTGSATGDLTSGATRILTATLLDAEGNAVTGSTPTVTFAKSGGGAGTVDGLGTAVAIDGIAEVTVTGSVAGALDVIASIASPSVSSSALAVTVAPGDIAKMTLTPSASGDLAAGATRVLTATIEDAKGNTVTSATGSGYAVTFAKAGGTGTLNGLSTVNPTNGVATTTITGRLVGPVTLTAATTVGVTTFTSQDVSFAVVPGAPSSVDLVASGLTAGTPDTLTAGSPATLTATIKDAQGNTVTASTASVTFGYASNTGTVTGLGSSAAVAGVATKSVTAALAGAVAVQATVASLSLTSSSVSFTVVPGAASSMSITTQPGGAVVGSALSPQPVIQVSDAQGNPIATSGLIITATVATGTGLNTGTVANDTATTDTSGIATFSGLKVTGDGGNYKLEFAATGLTAVTSSQFTLTKLPQTITFANPKPSGATYGDPPFPVAPTSTSGLDVVVASLTSATCQVSGANGRTVSITGAGSCQLRATQAGNGQVDAATPVTQSFTIAKAAQATVRIDSASTMSFGETTSLVASGGSGTGALAFGTPTGPCTLSGTTLTATGAGTCTVTASRSADGNYLVSSTATQAITIGKAGQVLAFTSTPPASPVSGGTYTPAASSTSTVTGSSTGLTTVFTIAPASSAFCAIDGSGEVSFTATGTCTIQANQAGNADVNAATQVTQVIEVGALNQSITFAQPANAAYGGSSVLMSASASSGLAVSFAAGSGTTGFGTGGAACVVSALGAVTINDIGTCEVVAYQAGDTQYAAASYVRRAFSIVAAVPGSPHITSVSAGDQQVTVAFTAPGNTGGAAISAYEVTAIPNAGGTTMTTSACSPSASPMACTITGLANGTAYTIKVAAINSAGTGSQSTAGQSMTPGAAAFAVTGLSAASGLDSVTLSWTPLTNAQLNGGTFTLYEVSYRLASGGAYTACPMDNATGLPVTPCSGSGNLQDRSTGSITVGGLAPGTSYEFKVVAITSLNDVEIAGNSETVTQFPITVPTGPQTLTVLNVAATTAQFSWTPPADDGGTPLVSPYYEVSVESADAGAATPITCTVTGTHCNATGMTNGAVYVFSIYAINAVGNSQVVTTSYSVPSDDATLANLVLGSGTALNPSFASNVTAYTATVPFSSSTVTVTPTATQPDSLMTVAGTSVVSGSASGAIALVVGSNAIPILVTAPDPTQKTIYTITVTRDIAPPPAPPAPAPDPGPSGGGGGGGGGAGSGSAAGPDLGLIVPAVTSTLASGSLQVLQDGEPVADVRVAPNRQDTGIDVTGRDFTMQVVTAAPDRRPVGLATGSGGPSLVAEVGGWVDVRATGYAAETTMRAYLARRGAPRSLAGANGRLVTNVDSVYLGDALVPANGDISTAFPIPSGVNLGDYVLQVNGISADRQVRSVNLTLTIVQPAAAQVVLRRGCVFPSGSAKPTRGCQRSLRVVSQRIPRDAIGLRIAIIGVSVDELTRPANRAIARKRARAVAVYLRSLGVRGTYVRTTMIAKSGPKSPLAARSVIVRNGQPRTTVTFRFTR